MDAQALFARHGLRFTQQRRRIYSALAATTAHPTAEQLHRALTRAGGGGASGKTSPRTSTISLATVYNTLEALTRKGLARRLPAARGKTAARYDADTREHAHFVDDDGDGTIRDLPIDLGRALMDRLPRDLIEEIERRMGVEVSRIVVKLQGRRTGREGAC